MYGIRPTPSTAQVRPTVIPLCSRLSASKLILDGARKGYSQLQYILLTDLGLSHVQPKMYIGSNKYNHKMTSDCS